MIKRFFDIILSIFACLVLILPIFIVAIGVRFTSPGPVLYWSERVGRHNKKFMMPKFRSMVIGAPVVATHLLLNPNDLLTPIGSFLRKSSIDELPQLWSIFIGQMSFVGPRPALFNQLDLISLRSAHRVDSIAPGLTGWAQVNGRDEISIEEKVILDKYYLENMSLSMDLKIIWMTFLKVLRRDGISH